MTFGDTLARFMRANSLSQYRLVRNAHIDKSTLSRLLKGQRNPSRNMIETLAAQVCHNEQERIILFASALMLPDALTIDQTFSLISLYSEPR